MILVGSKALAAYITVSRPLHDMDLWMSTIEYAEFRSKYISYLVKETPGSYIYDFGNEIVEIKVEDQFELTDRLIYNRAVDSKIYLSTCFGVCYLPDIQILYDMKCATEACIKEWKHSFDRILMKNKYFYLQENTELYKMRLQETKDRLDLSRKNKYAFFHKTSYKDEKIATIPEYVVHDKLHEMIADLIGLKIPSYIKTINGDTETVKELWDKLPYDEKVSLMAEESLVLALERWFIPQMVENGINYRLLNKFYNNNEAMPTYMILKHVNLVGLKGEQDYVTQFGKDNFNKIETKWIEYKDKIKVNGGFPTWMYDEIFLARDKYRNGEKVGIHHGY